MAKLIYAANVSLDGYMEDEHGHLEWSISGDEEFAFWTDFQRRQAPGRGSSANSILMRSEG